MSKANEAFVAASKSGGYPTLSFSNYRHRS